MEQTIIDLLERIRLLEVRLNREEVLEYNTAGGLSGTGTAGRITEWASASVLQDSTLIKSGAGVLTLSASGAFTLTVPATGTVALIDYANVVSNFEISSTITTVPRGLVITEAAAATALILMRRNSGAALTAGTSMATILGDGFDGTGYGNGAGGASITFQATGGTWTTSSRPGAIIFSTTPVGAVARVTRLTLDNAGNAILATGNLTLSEGIFDIYRSSAGAMVGFISGIGASYQNAGFNLYHDTTAPSIRWQFSKTADSQADLIFARFDDAGAFVDICFRMQRSSGNVMVCEGAGNLGVNTTTFGSSMDGGISIGDGTAPTTSITGTQQWSKANGLMWMKSGVAAPMGHNGYYGFSTTQLGNTALTETVIGNVEVLGSTLSRDGDRITFKASGSFTGTASINKQILVKFEGSTIFDTGALAITAAADWVLEGEIIRTGAATQKCNVSMATSSAALVAYANYAAGAETLANSLTLEIRGNGTNANDVVLEMLTVDFHASPN